MPDARRFHTPLRRLPPRDGGRYPETMSLNNRQKWKYGLWSGIIAAIASSLEISLAMIVAAPQQFNLHENLRKTLLTGSILGIIQGAKFAFAYLKQSPLPPPEE